MNIGGMLVVFKNGKRYAYKIKPKTPRKVFLDIANKYIEDKQVSIPHVVEALMNNQNISGQVRFKWYSSLIIDKDTILYESV